MQKIKYFESNTTIFQVSLPIFEFENVQVKKRHWITRRIICK